jgi:hypothetical protein
MRRKYVMLRCSKKEKTWRSIGDFLQTSAIERERGLELAIKKPKESRLSFGFDRFLID